LAQKIRSCRDKYLILAGLLALLILMTKLDGPGADLMNQFLPQINQSVFHRT
jgi:hypothetical protein